MAKHSELVKEDEKAVAAGLVEVLPDRVRMLDSYSSSLMVGTDQQHWDALGELFELPIHSKYESIGLGQH